MTKNLKESRSKNSEILSLNEKLVKQNETLIKEIKETSDIVDDCLKMNIELMEKEKFFLRTINDAMKVTEPKRFLIHRMSIAPFEPVKDIEEIIKD